MVSRTLAIDLGSKRVGLAISDPLGLTAQPLGFILFLGWSELIADLKKIIEEKSVKSVLIGLPKNMDGTLGLKAEESIKFSEMLRTECNLEVKLFDERLTTKQSENILINEFDLSRNRRKNVRDTMAACIILQSYLNHPKSSALTDI